MSDTPTDDLVKRLRTRHNALYGPNSCPSCISEAADALTASTAKVSALQDRVKELEAELGNMIDAFSKPNDRLCCDGSDCACRGSTIHEQAMHYARAALSTQENTQ